MLHCDDIDRENKPVDITAIELAGGHKDLVVVSLSILLLCCCCCNEHGDEPGSRSEGAWRIGSQPETHARLRPTTRSAAVRLVPERLPQYTQNQIARRMEH